MTKYFILGIGGIQKSEINKIVASPAYSDGPITIDIDCWQRVANISCGDLVFIWLTTPQKNAWAEGLRALGRIEKPTGPRSLHIKVGIVLPRSVGREETLDEIQKCGYKLSAVSSLPAIGRRWDGRRQLLEPIDPEQPDQKLSVLFKALEQIVPGFETALSHWLTQEKIELPATNHAVNDVPDANEDDDYDPGTGMSGEDTFDRHEPPPVQETVHKLEEPEPVSVWTRPVIDEKETPTGEAEDIFDPEEDRDREIEVPFDPSKIDITVKPITISSLEDRLLNDELDLTPDFQRRDNLWNPKRKARLIESILLRIPLPSFYFSEDEEGRYAVVDGLQRLCAIFHFKNVELLNRSTQATLSPLMLNDLQYLAEFNRKFYSDLDRKYQRRITELEITANIIRANTPPAVKFNVFARLNQGGMPLTAQEIRNAIFPGVWRDELRKLAKSEDFINVTGGKIPRDRQEDIELILRYVALWLLGKPYKRESGQETLDEFLNATVGHLHTNRTVKWVEIGKAFYRALNAIHQVRGEHAFRKSTSNQRKGRINRSLFETELIVFGMFDDSEISRLTNKKREYERRFAEELTSNEKFGRALQSGTGSPDSSNTRVETLSRIIKEILHA